MIQNESYPDGVAEAEELRGLCAAVTKLARHDLQARLSGHPSGLTAIEHGVLRQLSQGVASMAELSRRMGVAASTLVYVVDGLARRGLLRRTRDPKDRRREPLALETAGAELLASIAPMTAESALVRALTDFSPTERRELLGLLRRFVAALPGAEQR